MVGACRRGAFGAVPRGGRTVERAEITRGEWYGSSGEGVGDPDRDVRGRVRSGSVVAPMAHANIPFRRVIPDRPGGAVGEETRGKAPEDGNESDDAGVSATRGGGGEEGERSATTAAAGTSGSTVDGAKAKQDAVVTRWLERRGWGQYAEAFAAYGVTSELLPRLTMKDLEEMAVERTETRGRMYQALTAILMLREGNELDAATMRGNASASAGSSDGAGCASKRRAKGKVSKTKKRSRTDE